MTNFIFLLLVVFFVSACTEQIKTEDHYILQPVNEHLEYAIDDDTVIPLFNLYAFEENGLEYLTFSDSGTRTILIRVLF